MHKADRIRVQHMLDASREAMAFARDRTRADLPPLVAVLQRVLGA